MKFAFASEILLTQSCGKRQNARNFPCVFRWRTLGALHQWNLRVCTSEIHFAGEITSWWNLPSVGCGYSILNNLTSEIAMDTSSVLAYTSERLGRSWVNKCQLLNKKIRCNWFSYYTFLMNCNKLRELTLYVVNCNSLHELNYFIIHCGLQRLMTN